MAYWSRPILSDILFPGLISTFRASGKNPPVGETHLLLLPDVVLRRGFFREADVYTYTGEYGDGWNITTGGTRDIHTPFEKEAAQE